MLRLRDIMTEDVLTLDPDLSIRGAMELLAARHVSGAPVVSDGDVIGVLSATDLLQFAADLPALPVEREGDGTLADDLTMGTHLARDDEEGDGDDTRGLFFTELWDNGGSDVVERVSATASAERNALEEHTVSEAMTRPPGCAPPPDTLVRTAAEFMQRAKIHRVLVMQGQTLAGIVTSTDITQAVADGSLTSRTYVFGASRHFGQHRWDRRG